MRLRDKVAVITGASAGIGRACAERFAAEGAKVVLSDIDVTRGEEAAEAIQASGGDALFVACDVGDKAQAPPASPSCRARACRCPAPFPARAGRYRPTFSAAPRGA